MNTRTLKRRGVAVIAILCIITFVLPKTNAFQTMAHQGAWERAFTGIFTVSDKRANTITSPALYGYSLMREGLVKGIPTPDDLFITLPIQRQNVERVEIINLYIPESPDTFMAETNSAGGFRGRQIIAAVDITHADSDDLVVAFYTAGNTAGRYDVYIAGHGGVVATGDLQEFFRNLTNATSIDVTLLDTSSVTNMAAMFAHTHSLTSLDLSGFDTSNVTSMIAMFAYTGSLTSLDLSGFDTSSVTDMGYMFYNVSSPITVDFSKATFTNVTDNTSMFTGCCIDKITVGSTEAQTFIENALCCAHIPICNIVVANPNLTIESS